MAVRHFVLAPHATAATSGAERPSSLDPRLFRAPDRRASALSAIASVALLGCTPTTGDAAAGDKALVAPPSPVPASGPGVALGTDPQQAKIELGRRLMFDVDLSRPRGVSCGMCHDPQSGWGDGRPQGKGVQDNSLDSGSGHHDPTLAVDGNRYKTLVLPRNTPTVYNSMLFPNQFWDGRAGDLAHQAMFPFEAGQEMNSSWDDHIIPRLEADPTYVQMFVDAFGDATITRERGGEAIGAFEETIAVFDTPYDDYIAGDTNALSQEELDGYGLFVSKGCTACHVEPNLTDMVFHNTGVPSAGLNALSDTVDLGFGVREDLTVEPHVVHDDPDDYAKFKTPQLRMLAVTGPYMHNGAFETLEEVVEFYDQGGGPDLSGSGTKSPLLQPLGLTQQERDALVAFLETGLMGTEIK